MCKIDKKTVSARFCQIRAIFKGVNDNHKLKRILRKNGAICLAKRTKSEDIYVQKHDVGESNSLVNNCLIIAVCA